MVNGVYMSYILTIKFPPLWSVLKASITLVKRNFLYLISWLISLLKGIFFLVMNRDKPKSSVSSKISWLINFNLKLFKSLSSSISKPFPQLSSLELSSLVSRISSRNLVFSNLFSFSGITITFELKFLWFIYINLNFFEFFIKQIAYL